jgi:hypothetical protein
VVLEGPAQEHPRVPGVAADIVVPAHRVRATPIPDDWGLTRDWRYEAEPREPVMRFRFASLGDETYVMARCDERLSPARDDFLAVLARLQARYPAIGPPLQAYAAELAAREKERLRRGFGDGEPADGSEDAGLQPAAPNGAEAPPPQAPAGGANPQQGHPPLGPPPQGPPAHGPPSHGPPPLGLPARRRGRKRTDPREINRICAAWLKAQDRVTQVDFCNGRGVSPSQLRSWLKGYPHPEE